MDLKAYIHRRRKRYMAKILAQFEETLEPKLRRAGVPEDEIENFKGYVRQKMNALAVDICQVVDLKPGEEINGAAVELRDRITSG